MKLATSGYISAPTQPNVNFRSWKHSAVGASSPWKSKEHLLSVPRSSNSLVIWNDKELAVLEEFLGTLVDCPLEQNSLVISVLSTRATTRLTAVNIGL